MEQVLSDRPRCRILVVEDEAMIAMLVEGMVTGPGSLAASLRRRV
jgi:hypothetical protein